jgi:hypothetical protein
MRDPSNTLFSLAAEFINYTSRSVFLTGKAGTGKTTFLKYIASHTNKQLAIAAPTGVAAINAGGMTLHSLFQLPFGIYLPTHKGQHSTMQITTRSTLFQNLHLSQSKRDVLKGLELLIIDEISMVRCDMLDAVDVMLRTVRRNQKPFGGVQVLFIGDLYQLSPVAKNEEWALLKEHYESPFFFHSKVIHEAPPLCIELTKIYRQNEQTFIDLLNSIRNNQLEEQDLQLLNSRLHKQPDEGAVTLTTHNAKADTINDTALRKLPGLAFTFKAEITGEFPDRNYPTEEALTLKRGARIMFIKNDSSEEKQYYNGKMATITHVDEDAIEAEFDTGGTMDVPKEVWRNIRYLYNSKTDTIEEEELGSFTQYPLRLAWAITIHKSQGLTFQKAGIDAGSSFAPGQVYVALSRCTSLEGLTLQSVITEKQIITDPHVVAYSRQLTREHELIDLLPQEKRVYERQRFIDLFDFANVKQAITEWAAEVPEKKLPDVDAAIAISRKLSEQADELLLLATKTQQWMERNFNAAAEANKEDTLVQGLTRSVSHFNNLLHDQFFVALQQHLATLKGKSKVKKYTREVIALGQLIATVAAKIRSATWNGALLLPQNNTPFTETLTAKSVDEKPTVNSAWESKLLFDSGIAIEGIASARGLAQSTIEGHLAQFVKTGDIDIKKLVSEEKMAAIRSAFAEMQTTSLSQVKQKLGEAYSYAEIRMVFNWLESKKQEP